MKIAIVGSGISGLTAAHHLHKTHDIQVFEAGAHIGGHTNTRDVTLPDGTHWAVDTGFIVFNHQTYPNFLKLLGDIGVEAQATTMSFSVNNRATGVEFSSEGAAGLFAQRRNLFRPSFYRMLSDVLSFRKAMNELVESGDQSLTLGEFFRQGRYSQAFWEEFLVPMGAAIWSSPDGYMEDFPATFFARFFFNHRFLEPKLQPQWYVIKGGSRSYVEKLVVPFRDRIRLDCPVASVTRGPGGVTIRTAGGETEHYDKLIMACHSDQTLRLLDDASADESRILGAFPYQKNVAVLHTDIGIMPESRRAWASWNHRVSRDGGPVSVTYDMTRLQGLDASARFLVTLNDTEHIRDEHVIETINYAHPLFGCASAAAQKEHGVINGVNHTYFCGAYWRYGFHEDGVVSAMNAIAPILDQSDREGVGAA